MRIGTLFARPRPAQIKKTNEWSAIEYFDPVWENRVIALAAMIQGKGRIVDFGCGKQHLRKHLPPGTRYIPVDYTSRSPDTIVVDFNKLPYPGIDGEVAFFSGFLEYLEDLPSFVKYIKELSYQEMVLSYCTLESVSSIDERVKLAWKNHFALEDLLRVLLNPFTLHSIGSVSRNTIFRLERKL